MQNIDLRQTGIEIIGDVPWGTHFCQFYQTKQDLIDILVPYFKAGLQNNELCVLVTSGFLDTKEALVAMKEKIPNFSKYFKKGQIEVFPHTEWYLKGGSFEMKRVLADWVNKHNYALKKGYAGVRVSGNPFWIDNKKDWNDFARYEAEINKVIDRYKILVLCTYSLKKCVSQEVIDVVSNHEFALIKRKGQWVNIESSKHREMAESLRRSEERYRSYVEVTGQLGWTTNAKGEAEGDIPSWRKYTGQTYEQIKGAGWVEALHPGDRAHTMGIWKKAVRTKSSYETEYRVRRYDGVYRYFLVRGIPVIKNNGVISEWVGTCIDITERKKIEKKMLHLASFPQLNPNPLIELDLNGQVTLYNPAAINTLKKLKVKQDVKKFLPPDITEIVKDLKKSQESQVFYREVTIKNSTFAENVYLSKKLGLIRFYSIDITQRKKMEEQLAQHTLQLENLNKRLQEELTKEETLVKSINEFVSIASHELRTPLSAISWAMERLHEVEYAQYSVTNNKYLDQIDKQTQRMIKLTESLLDATRMELGVFSYQKEKLNPVKIASKVLANFEDQIKNKKINFRFVFGKDNQACKTSSNAVQTILSNLLSNAVKFTPTGGKIDLKIFNKDNQLIFEIADTGLGIPKSVQNKIFKKAYRADNVRNQFEGTGFGLYITKVIVDRMGGKIGLQSVPEKGTTFTVVLPRN